MIGTITGVVAFIVCLIPRQPPTPSSFLLCQRAVDLHVQDLEATSITKNILGQPTRTSRFSQVDVSRVNS